MSPSLSRSLVLAAALLLAGASTGLAANSAAGGASEIKRIADRYALTRARINALLTQRLHPTPLPANPPNPFYQTPKELVGPAEGSPEQAEPSHVPDAADLSDGDALRKYALTLKIGGLITRNDQPFLTINNTTCKAGDIITVGSKERPVYLRLLSFNQQEITVGLNDATYVIPLKK